jgi:hypothetical protein
METSMALTWNRTLNPEELELVEEWLSDRCDPSRKTVVYVLLLASGAVYTGVSYNPKSRLREHINCLSLAPENCVAVPVEDKPGEIFVAVHGLPEIAVTVDTPSRRHAFLLEALVTDGLAQRGVHVYGANFDRAVPRWERNEFKGVKLDDAKRLVDMVAEIVETA